MKDRDKFSQKISQHRWGYRCFLEIRKKFKWPIFHKSFFQNAPNSSLCTINFSDRLEVYERIFRFELEIINIWGDLQIVFLNIRLSNFCLSRRVQHAMAST